MNSTYVNNILCSSGEASVVISDHATKAARHSCKMAESFHKAGMDVLLINCGMSPQRFREYAPEATDYFGYDEDNKFQISPITRRKEGDSRMMTLDSVRGDLASMDAGIRELVTQCDIRVIIISGWEWASSSWRRKQRLLFFLKEMMAEFKCTVIVYAQTATKPTAGVYDRGGIGHLSTLAFAITDIRGAEVSAVLVPPKEVTAMTEMEWFEFERRAQLEPKETNILRMPKMRIVPDRKRNAPSISEVAFQQVN